MIFHSSNNGVRLVFLMNNIEKLCGLLNLNKDEDVAIDIDSEDLEKVQRYGELRLVCEYGQTE